MQQNVFEPDPLEKKLFTEKLDQIFLNRRWGYLILIRFYSCFFKVCSGWHSFRWMDRLDFTKLSSLVQYLPEGWFSGLMVNGLLPASAEFLFSYLRS